MLRLLVFAGGKRKVSWFCFGFHNICDATSTVRPSFQFHWIDPMTSKEWREKWTSQIKLKDPAWWRINTVSCCYRFHVEFLYAGRNGDMANMFIYIYYIDIYIYQNMICLHTILKCRQDVCKPLAEVITNLHTVIFAKHMSQDFAVPEILNL